MIIYSRMTKKLDMTGSTGGLDYSNPFSGLKS